MRRPRMFTMATPPSATAAGMVSRPDGQPALALSAAELRVEVAELPAQGGL